MPIWVRVAPRKRRKQDSLLRIENRRQHREHYARPRFGVMNHAKVLAAGLKWEYQRCPHGVMGDGTYCYVCNPPDLNPPPLAVTGNEPWAAVCIRMGRSGVLYYHAGDDLAPSERSHFGVWEPELLEQEGEERWYELVAQGTTRRVEFDGGWYWEFLPQFAGDWQPPVVHTPADGPTVELMNGHFAELPYRPVDERKRASKWWNRRREHVLLHGKWVEGARWQSIFPRPLPVLKPHVWQTYVPQRIDIEDVRTRLPLRPDPPPIPRATWTPPTFPAPERVAPRMGITMCPPMPASATYRFEVPQVRYRHTHLDWGFYGDGHSESKENRGAQVYP